MELNNIFCGDCLEGMKTLPDNSVDCCVTSPPYFGLRDYGVAGQMGLEGTPDEYVGKMVAVFNEVRRILKPTGTLFLNIGDSYYSNPGNGRGGGSKLRGGKPHHSDSKRVISCGTSGKEPVNYPKNDCLCGSLCDVCRKAYQIGKSHKDYLHVPKQVVLPSLPIHEHKEFENGRSPTLDSSQQVSHNLPAIQDSKNFEVREDEQPLSFAASTLPESSLQQQKNFPQLDNFSSCLLCGCSFSNLTQVSVDKSVCTCGIQENGHPLNQDKSDIFSSHKAYNKDTNIQPISTLKQKDLIGIPWMVAFALRSTGWYLRGDIIWHKKNCMPESVKDRPTRSHEFIFLMSKSAKYYYDYEAIMEPAIYDIDGTGTAARKARAKVDLKSFPSGINAGIRQAKLKDATLMNGKYSDKQRGHSRKHAGFNERWDNMTKEEQCMGMRNKRDVWIVSPAQFPESHFATFPEDLIVDCIKAGCPEYGIVLDPFMGAGTTALVARKLERNFIGFELNPEYIEIANRRLKAELGLFI